VTWALESAIVAVYTIFGSEEEARRIGRDMVERRLAACVNILGSCHSIYRWQGRVEAADEVAAIHLAHSYDVPAIVTLPIATTHREFLAWVLAQTGQG
jgi:periplasmic divalent cation tolerance protein